MCLCILFISLKMLKSSSSGLILINTQVLFLMPFIEFIIVCSLVLITSCSSNSSFFLDYMIYLFYNPLLFLMLNQYVKIFYLIVLLVYFTNSHLRFLYILLYLFVMTGKFLWPYFSSIFCSFSHNALTLSTITSMPLFFHVFFVIFKISLYIQKKKENKFLLFTQSD